MEEIITDLAHFSNLQVISSYTSRKIGADDRDVMAVAEELSIDYLLKGNLLQKGEQIRIYTQLIQYLLILSYIDIIPQQHILFWIENRGERVGIS